MAIVDYKQKNLEYKLAEKDSVVQNVEEKKTYNPLILVHKKLMKYHEKKGDIKQYLNSMYKKTSKLLYSVFKKTNKLEINGLENLESLTNQSFIIVSNHQKVLDPIYVCAALKNYENKVRWISKQENFDNELFKVMLDIGGVISLGMNEQGKRIMTNYSKEKIQEVFDNKEVLGLFPEGTRNKTEAELLPFHTGAVRMCQEQKVPYVPIALVGTPQPFKGKVKINIGKPVYVNTENNYEKTKQLTNEMRENMLALLHA